MFNKEWQKTLAIVLIAVLFGLIILTAYHFVREPEVVDITDPGQVQETPTIQFENLSSMSESEIRDLAEMKRAELRNYLDTYPSYKVSEAFEGYSEEDDDSFEGIGKSYFDGFHQLVTDEFFNTVFANLQMGDLKPTVTVPEEIYIVPVDLFEDYYFHSAIAEEDYNQEELILKKATDDRIEMVEKLKYCREDLEDVCMRDDSYEYVLERVDGDFKIARIR